MAIKRNLSWEYVIDQPTQGSGTSYWKVLNHSLPKSGMGQSRYSYRYLTDPPRFVELTRSLPKFTAIFTHRVQYHVIRIHRSLGQRGVQPLTSDRRLVLMEARSPGTWTSL